MEKKINIENYEAYLLDLAEGKLSYADEKALIQFLARHPELEVDLEELPVLEAEVHALDSSFKTALLKNPASGLSERDHLMISSIEGQLSVEEERSFRDLLQDEDAQKELAYYQKTKLAAASIVYPDKDQLLKKESRVVPLWTMISSIAAAILLMLYMGLPQESTYTPRGFAFEAADYQDEEVSFAFVIEEQLESKEADDRSNTSEVSDQVPANFLAEKAKPQKEETKGFKEDKELMRTEEVAPIETQNFAELEKSVPEITPMIKEENMLTDEIADSERTSRIDETESSQARTLSPLEYARELIKKDVLKNRTLAESVKEEVESLTNKRVNFEQAENESDAQFALNIGGLKIRKK
jgi:hypothetical protein